jgi:hypothetical protein
MLINQLPESDPDEAGGSLLLPQALANNDNANKSAILRYMRFTSSGAASHPFPRPKLP